MQTIRAHFGAIGARVKQFGKTNYLIDLRVIVLLVLALPLVAVSFERPLFALNSNLEGKEWVLQSFGDVDSQQPVVADRRLTVEFSSEDSLQTISGSGGCSPYLGNFEVIGNTLSIDGFSIWPMFCWGPEESENIIMDQQSAFLSALGAAESFQITGDKLEIFYDLNQKVLTFVIDPAADLEDEIWLLSSYGDVSNQQPVLESTKPTAIFEWAGATRIIRGSGGCNIYWGSIETTGNQLAIGEDEFQITAMYCIYTGTGFPDTIIMEQEAAFMSGLDAAESFQITGNKLEIFYDSGQKVLTFFADPAAELPGKLWWLHSFGEVNNQQTLLEGTWGWIEFLPEGTPLLTSGPAISGHGGCNVWDAHYETNGNQLSVFDIWGTQVSCGLPGLDDQELAFMSGLDAAESFLVTGNKLEIFYDSGQKVLTFFIDPAADLSSTKVWRLYSYGNLFNQQPVLDRTRITLEFSRGDGTSFEFHGYAGCNGYFGDLETTGNQIEIGDFGMTLMLCLNTDPAFPESIIMDQEQAYTSALLAAESFRVTGDKLEIIYDSGQKVLTFFLDLISALEGKVWKLSSYGEAHNQQPVLADSNVTLEFNYRCPTAAELNGGSGCNAYWGVAGLFGNVMRTSSLHNTLMYCPKAGIMEQEVDYLSALRRAVRFQLTNDSTLEIFYGSGDEVLTFSVQD